MGIFSRLLCLCAFVKGIQQVLPECQNGYFTFSPLWELSNAGLSRTSQLS